MNLNAYIRGNSMEQLMTRSVEACEQFYGDTPYEITTPPYVQAIAVEFDSDTGLPTVYGLDMQAQARPVAG